MNVSTKVLFKTGQDEFQSRKKWEFKITAKLFNKQPALAYA